MSLMALNWAADPPEGVPVLGCCMGACAGMPGNGCPLITICPCTGSETSQPKRASAEPETSAASSHRPESRIGVIPHLNQSWSKHEQIVTEPCCHGKHNRHAAKE